MSIEHLVTAIQNLRRENDEFVPPPATEDAIEALTVTFQGEFGVALPEAYQRVSLSGQPQLARPSKENRKIEFLSF